MAARPMPSSRVVYGESVTFDFSRGCVNNVLRYLAHSTKVLTQTEPFDVDGKVSDMFCGRDGPNRLLATRFVRQVGAMQYVPAR
jgi:hypothetical protein